MNSSKSFTAQMKDPRLIPFKTGKKQFAPKLPVPKSRGTRSKSPGKTPNYVSSQKRLDNFVGSGTET